MNLLLKAQIYPKNANCYVHHIFHCVFFLLKYSTGLSGMPTSQKTHTKVHHVGGGDVMDGKAWLSILLP